MKRWMISGLTVLVLTLGAWANPKGLTPAQTQNVQSAVQFLNQTGHTVEATVINTKLAAGQIKADSVSGANGETTAGFPENVIDNGTIGMSRRPFGSDRFGFANIATLAKTLVHENVHSNQSTTQHVYNQVEHLVGADHDTELEAWATQLNLEGDWIEQWQSKLAQAKADGLGDAEILELTTQLNSLVTLHKADLDGFIKNDYGAYNRGQLDAAALSQAMEALSNQLKAETEALENRLANQNKIMTGAAMTDSRGSRDRHMFNPNGHIEVGGGLPSCSGHF